MEFALADDVRRRALRLLLTARAIRGFADGLVSILLVFYLRDEMGFTADKIGYITTATLIGSAALTLYAGLRWGRFPARTVLLGSCGLMVLTGVGFAFFTRFWPLMAIAVIGTLNPSGGDVSLFLPTEQAALSEIADPVTRTKHFARYNLAGGMGAALGSLCAAVPQLVSDHSAISLGSLQRSGFVVYGVCAVAAAAAYRKLPNVPRVVVPGRAVLHTSKRTVYRLAALFSIDAAGGGFVVQTLLVAYLVGRFRYNANTISTVLAITAFCSAYSQLISARLAARFGLVRTMVFTHLPANLLLVLAGIVPIGAIAITFLIARSFVSAMDVPARQALVMAVVEPDERAAAASVTNVPRSLASATTPSLAGTMLQHSAFGWPLILAGSLKAAYDLLLLRESLDHELR